MRVCTALVAAALFAACSSSVEGDFEGGAEPSFEEEGSVPADGADSGMPDEMYAEEQYAEDGGLPQDGGGFSEEGVDSEDGSGPDDVSDEPPAELCNGLDDDGDGEADEDFIGLGQPCDGPDSDACKNGVFICKEDGTGIRCGPESPSGIVESCNGLDDDCDGQLPAEETDADNDGIIDCLEGVVGYDCGQGYAGRPVGGGEGYGLWVDPDGPNTVRVGDLDGLLQALSAARPGDVVYVDDDAEIDMSPMADQPVYIPTGVTLASGRGRSGSAGGLLYTTAHDYNTHSQVRVFTVRGPGVRITGLRFRGPDTEVGEVYQSPLISGIQTSFPADKRHWDFEVDNCEFWGWPTAAVSIYRTDRAWVHHNFFHHNRRAGLGYGVVVNYANPVIGANIFQHNRHGIASTGYPTTGYEACHNVVLPGATSTSFDMHGGFDKGFYPDTAGSVILIHHNQFLAGTVDGIGIRGVPTDFAEFHSNTFVHSPTHTYPSAMWQRYFPKAPDCLYNNPSCVLTPWDEFPGFYLMNDRDTCRGPCEPSQKWRDPADFDNIDVHDNTYGASHRSGWFYSWHGEGFWMLRRFADTPLSEVLIGDFDGDGADDGLVVSGGSWVLYPAFRLDPVTVNSSSVARSELAAGDFDGDGKADVFWADGAAWRVSYGAGSGWVRVNTSGYRVDSLAFCDFDGDGKTDVFRTNGSAWFVSWGASTSWQQLNARTEVLSQLRFGDLDGDGACDVFFADGAHWQVAWAGQGNWQQINTSGITEVRLADLDGNGRADVVRSSGGTWYVSRDGRSSWKLLNTLLPEGIGDVEFADLDGDGAADMLSYR